MNDCYQEEICHGIFDIGVTIVVFTILYWALT